MSTALQPVHNLAPGANLEAYIQSVSSIPVLSADEERVLADRLYYHEDLEAARQLVMSHLRFVVHIARSYSGYGLAQSDLVQEGNVGLMKAVKRFNPEMGVRLVSFAVHWIRAEIHEFILRNWRIVKVATTKAQRKLFFNLRSAKKKLAWAWPSAKCARWKAACTGRTWVLMVLRTTTMTTPTRRCIIWKTSVTTRLPSWSRPTGLTAPAAVC